MSHGALAIIIAFGLVVLHLQQVQMLSGSLGEFWRRRDESALLSKAFFALALLSSLLVLAAPFLGISLAFAFAALHFGFSMEEWKR